MATRHNIQSWCWTQVKSIKYNTACALFVERTPTAIRSIVTIVVWFFYLYATAQTEITDTIVESATVRSHIDFKVNLTDLDCAYHGNDTLLNRVLVEIDTMVLNPNKKVGYITVTGTASPEGPYDNNVRLATNRAKTLIRILQNRYSFPDSIYRVSTIPEDWEGMRIMLVENDSIPFAGTLLNFLDETAGLSPDLRESRLKRLDKGRPYASMLKNVLPYLRRAAVTVDYDTEWHRRRQTPISIVEMPELVLPMMPVGIDSMMEPKINIIHIPAIRKQRFVAIKTNLLWDATLCANLGVEVELWPHWSLDIPVWYSPYDITERWRIRLLATQPEVRYWLKDAGMGHYFGVYTSIIGFNVSFNGDFRYQDPNHAAFGVGVGYGYAFHLDKAQRWGLELQAGAGYIGYKWIKYHNTGRNGAEVSRSSGTYWGITRLGVTLSYKLYRERKGRRWMKW